MARSGLGAGACVRGPPPRGRAGRGCLRGARARCRAGPDGAGGARRVPGLPDGDARALLESVVTVRSTSGCATGSWPRRGATRWRCWSWPRGLTPEELAGGFGLPGAPAAAGRIEESFRRRLTPLPPATRQLLLVAAAEPVGDPVLVWRAADRLGRQATAAAAAASAGLIEFGGQVRFCHPLVRSAVYRAASPQERQSAHRALAEATDPDIDPDRRAWHRAHAAPGLDEDVAAELERSAGRARARGGLAAAAAFCERAAELTPDRARRARRALAAAQAKQQARRAGRRAAAAGHGAGRDRWTSWARARAELLRAQLAADPGRGSDAPALAARGGQRLEPLHLGLARDAYRDAFCAALSAGRLADPRRDAWRSPRPRGRCRRPRQPRAPDLLLDGLAVLATEGYAAGAPILRRALTAFRDEEVLHREGLRWLPLACRVAQRHLGRRELVCALGPADRAGPRSRGAGRAPGRAAHGRRGSAARRRVGRGRLDRRGGRGGRPGDGNPRGPYGASDARRLEGPRSRNPPADRGHHGARWRHAEKGSG